METREMGKGAKAALVYTALSGKLLETIGYVDKQLAPQCIIYSPEDKAVAELHAKKMAQASNALSGIPEDDRKIYRHIDENGQTVIGFGKGITTENLDFIASMANSSIYGDTPKVPRIS